MDTSAEMLARAREKVPDGEFHEADLHDLPLGDDSVDLEATNAAWPGKPRAIIWHFQLAAD